MQLFQIAWKAVPHQLIALFLGFPLIQHPAVAQPPAEKAWSVLQTGLADQSAGERAIAVRMLGLLENDPKAPELGVKSIERPKTGSAYCGRRRARSDECQGRCAEIGRSYPQRRKGSLSDFGLRSLNDRAWR